MNKEKSIQADIEKKVNIMGRSLILAYNTWDKDTAEHQRARDNAIDMFTKDIVSLLSAISWGEERLAKKSFSKPLSRDRVEEIIEETHKDFKKEIPYGANLFYKTLSNAIVAEQERE